MMHYPLKARSINHYYLILLISGACSFIPFDSFSQSHDRFHVQWKESPGQGNVGIQHGRIRNIGIAGGKVKGHEFRTGPSGNARLTVEVSDANKQPGPEPTVIAIKTPGYSFSFFLRDISKEYPVYIPEYGVAVLEGSDTRSYQEVERDVLLRKTKTKIQRIEDSEEASFASAAPKTRDMTVPVWLGIGRDFRMFDISEELEDMAQEGKIIRPKYASHPVKLAETDQQAAYLYTVGRGVGVVNNITRGLEEGALPIYHSDLLDDDIAYRSVSFVSFAKLPLQASAVKGTHYVVSDKHSHGRTFKEEHRQEAEERMKTAYDFDDDMVLYSRTIIENTGSVPRYAWLKTPRPGTAWWSKKIHTYDPGTGFSSYDGNRVFCISKLNGQPLVNEEIAILLKPGESARYEFFMPHSPVSGDVASELSRQSFSQRLTEAKTYWKEKLSSAAAVRLPEKRIEEMTRAGLLHLDLVTFGEEPKGTVSANIGVYSPIGTESAPIIQYYLSMGWHDLARRALNYFLETQLSSGYIQNYEGYTVETGAALWMMGEYMRYTRDINWLSSSKEKILKSCDYLIRWRHKNKKEELRGRGYGMIDGKVADPEDHYHQFMLNGYACLGLSRIAEALRESDPGTSNRIQKEADEWKADILQTIRALMAISPVVPLGDGRWVPTVPPWAEADGLRALFQKKEVFWSHGTFTAADALLGPLYLVFCEVIAPGSAEAKILLDYHSELFYQGNSAFSQPYYSRHNWLQARLGMVKPFLNTYYHTFSAHADRETYTFWEHMFRVSQHKTHEEAWFLMETRWMLYMEEGDALKVFPVIPRRWLADGEEIRLENAGSYFGALDIHAVSHIREGHIEAEIRSRDQRRKPGRVIFRLPHPEGKKPVRVSGGQYDEETESVVIPDFTGTARVRLEF